MSEEKKIQLYICSGCDIGESIDTEKLCNIAKDEFKLEGSMVHPFLCGNEGIDAIKKDVAGGVNCAVIGACSARVLAEKFSFGPSVIVERVNLREGVAWVSEPKHEDTQMLAEDYIRIGIVKTEKTGLPEPYKEEMNKTILVIGGGSAGLTSAIEASRAGRNVLLVEKEKELGGFAIKMKKRTPHSGNFEELSFTGIEKKIETVTVDPRIKVFRKAQVASISGQPGMFDVVIKVNGGEEKLRVGAVILGTGWKPYDAGKLGHLGYGRLKNVITGVEMEKMALDGKIARPSDGREVKSVAFIQCAGSRDEKHLPYCSSVCCMVSLKQAAYIREQNPESKVYVLYKDMRTPGLYENFYKKMQEDEGLFFTKSEIVSVEEDESGNIILTAKDTLLGEEDIKIKVDMVVLATGMESAATNGGALNLKYRQGPELPELAHGFPDSHFICFPYETRRTGIYAAGCVRHPMDISSTQTDAAGAVLKAIQCIELSSQGKSVHPRSGDTSYPEIAMERCTQCKRCTEECPYGMYDEDKKFNPLPNPLRCRRCGTCMGACPQRIISFKDYSVDMYSSMIKAISVPDEEEEKPRVLILACENDSIPAFDMAGLSRMKFSPFVRVIGLRCLGSLNLIWLNDAFAKGIDGVILFGCKYGDDYQCHNIKGSELGNERMGKLEETLGRMAIEPERVAYKQLTINEYDKLPQIIEEFMEIIERVGPNPFKEFGDFG